MNGKRRFYRSFALTNYTDSLLDTLLSLPTSRKIVVDASILPPGINALNLGDISLGNTLQSISGE